MKPSTSFHRFLHLGTASRICVSAALMFTFVSWAAPDGAAAAGGIAGAAGSNSVNVVDLDVSNATTHLTLTSSAPLELHYQMELGELQAMNVSTPEGVFTRLVIPGFHASHEEGLPELPMMNRLIEVPFGATPVVNVLSRQTRELDLADFGLTAPLFPAQPSMPKNVDPADWPFVVDLAAYTAPAVARDLVRVEDMGQMRAVHIGRLEVSPVEYLPTEGKVIVTESLELSIRFENADLVAGDELSARTASPFFDSLYDRIEGYRSTHDDHPNPVNPIVTMVVVTYPDFAAQLQPFVDWKTERGFHVILASLGDPDVGTTKESVQAYLHGLYENATPEMPAPSFVLFVGDIAEMPTWTLSGDATDRPYCDMEGDLCPDVLYGRFSATNPTELQNILDKTLMYEQFTMPDPSYLGEVVMIAGMDGTFGPTHGNGQINYGTDTYFNAAHGIYSYTYLYPNSGSHSADIVQNVSDGVAFINYTAHGSQTSWSDPSFSQTQVRGLQNDGEYCLAVGNCCLTSSFQVAECFAETWLRVPNKGAIGYIGGSNSTYWDEDYWWGVGYRSTVVPNPTYEDTGTGAYDGLFHDHGEEMAKWYVVNDALIFAGNLAVMEAGSNLITYYWNIYNLMGDPSLCTYLGVPSANPVVHPETVFTTWDTFQIEAAPGSYVGFTQNGELKGAGTVDMSGVLDLELIAPATPGPGRLVVMAQNREPYITDLNVIIPAEIVMDPLMIECGTETEITVGVFEYDGVTPKPGVEVWADGFLYESGHATTDDTGYCTAHGALRLRPRDRHRRQGAGRDLRTLPRSARGGRGRPHRRGREPVDGDRSLEPGASPPPGDAARVDDATGLHAPRARQRHVDDEHRWELARNHGRRTGLAGRRPRGRGLRPRAPHLPRRRGVRNPGRLRRRRREPRGRRTRPRLRRRGHGLPDGGRFGRPLHDSGRHRLRPVPDDGRPLRLSRLRRTDLRGLRCEYDRRPAHPGSGRLRQRHGDGTRLGLAPRRDRRRVPDGHG
ncbi:MAG: C25 family cysteine peptidase [Candidatus Eisenbacteria bacterium]